MGPLNHSMDFKDIFAAFPPQWIKKMKSEQSKGFRQTVSSPQDSITDFSFNFH